MSTSTHKHQSTTIRLPKSLYEKARAVVAAREESLNEFFVQAVREKIANLGEREIDQAFSEMATDPDYQRDAVGMADEFAKSDWEAFRATDRKRKYAPHARFTKARSR